MVTAHFEGLYSCCCIQTYVQCRMRCPVGRACSFGRDTERRLLRDLLVPLPLAALSTIFQAMHASYDLHFVFLSYAVATLASFTALHLASRVAVASPLSRRIWIAGGAVAMGFGIWSMHFIGMLAMSLPISLSYDASVTGASGLVAIFASALALAIMGSNKLTVNRLAAGAVVMGAAICGMHYTGMAAIPVAPGIRYDWRLVALSAVVAVVASAVALWLVFFLTQRRNKTHAGWNLLAAAVLGSAICGMHYTGMAAAHFSDGSLCTTGASFNKYMLAYGVSLAAALLLAAALSLSMFDAHLTRQRELTLQLLKENQALSHKAQHDFLTGLPNRSQLEERLDSELQQAKAAHRDLAVLFIDLDGFKAVNDAAGHATGDVVLKAVAARLTARAGQAAFVSRVSGDEFVVLVAGRSVGQLEMLCVELLEALRLPIEAAGTAYTVSASVGVALRLSPYDDVRTMLSRADQAMYAAKKNGKNGFRFADNSHAAVLAQEMERALRNGEFELYFQPTVDAQSLEITGAEALIRWNHPTRGLVPPGEFIPVAEELGFIGELGTWVLQDAIAKLAHWQQEGFASTIAVNLSPVQLLDDTLPQRVAALLTKHRVAPAGLILEVTETFAMTDIDRCQRVLLQLRALGLTIAVDDFGTGYSSLSHLYRLPVGELKIDKSFVQALTGEGNAEQICGAMVALAHSLNLTVVAEGVETKAQQVALSRLGCDTFQGYRFGKPMKWAELTARLSRTRSPLLQVA